VSFDLELKGRRALVTGGTKGVGAAVVETLTGEGVEVIAPHATRLIDSRRASSMSRRT
jgi:NAD(P)-dependent dehydrogenase (short-subunit alcohol dehydrogenase family)